MRVIVVGLGVQGLKRRCFAGSDFVAAADPVNRDAEYRNLQDIPLADFDAVWAFGQVDTATVVRLVSHARIVNHLRVVDRNPSGIVNV